MFRFIAPCPALCALMLLGCNAVDGNANRGDAGTQGQDAGTSTRAGVGGRSALAKEFPCLGESGVHTQEGGNTRGPEPLCTNLNAEARCVGTTTAKDVDRTCSSDADCVWATFAPSCVDHCYTSAIVSKAGAKVIADAVDELESDVCSRFDDAGCTYLPSGCPPPGGPSDPICDAGQCVGLSGCGLGPHRAAPLIAEELPTLAEGCTTDEECRVEHPSACDWSCPVPALVAKVNTVRYNGLLASIRTACDGTQAGTGGCPIPPCDPAPDPEAVCRDGTCVAR
jgi:hypothetical protein